MLPAMTERMPRIGVLAPMRTEFKPLVKPLGLEPIDDTYHRGAIGGVEIIVPQTCIGTQSATEVTKRLLDDHELDHVIVVGIAGGLGPGVHVGDLVFPEVVVDRPNGTTHRATPIGGIELAGVIVTSDEFNYPARSSMASSPTACSRSTWRRARSPACASAVASRGPRSAHSATTTRRHRSTPRCSVSRRPRAARTSRPCSATSGRSRGGSRSSVVSHATRRPRHAPPPELRSRPASGTTGRQRPPQRGFTGLDGVEPAPVPYSLVALTVHM